MKDTEIIVEIMKDKGITQDGLAKMCGYKQRSNISAMLYQSKHGLRSDSLIRILKAMGCELVIRDDNGNEWEVEI